MQIFKKNISCFMGKLLEMWGWLFTFAGRADIQIWPCVPQEKL